MAIGRNIITTRITLEGAQELIAKLKEIGREGSESLKHIQDTAQKVQGPPTKFEARMKAIGASLKATGAQVTLFGKQVTSVGASMSLVSAAVAGVVTGFVVLAEHAGRTADEMNRSAQSAGLTITEFAKLSQAAKEAGVEAGTFTTAMARLSKNILAAKTGNGEAGKTFRRLGVDIEKAGKIRPTIDIVSDLVAEFNKLPDGAEKSALAISLFGRGGAQLIPFLNTTSEELQQVFLDVERLGLGFTKTEAVIGDKFSDTIEKILLSLSRLRDHIGIIFVPTLQKLADATIELIATIREPILSAFQAIADAFAALPPSAQQIIAGFIGIVVAAGPLLLALGLFIQVIGFALAGLGSLAGIIPGIAAAFSGWAIIIAVLVGALAFLAIEVIKHWSEIRATILRVITDTTKAFDTFKAAVLRVWNAIVNSIRGFLNNIKSMITGWVADVTALFLGLINTVTGMFDDLASNAKSALDKVLGWLSDVISKAAAAARAITDAVGITGGKAAGGPVFARGGRVRGPGTATSDSIPARLSAGEFVIRAAAVRKYGASIFAALNGMRLSDSLAMPFHFASGGMVPALSGGGSGSGSVINLAIDGMMFPGLIAPEDTAQRLVQFARTRQIHSAGRAPNWKGGNNG